MFREKTVEFIDFGDIFNLRVLESVSNKVSAEFATALKLHKEKIRIREGKRSLEQLFVHYTVLREVRSELRRPQGAKKVHGNQVKILGDIKKHKNDRRRHLPARRAISVPATLLRVFQGPPRRASLFRQTHPPNRAHKKPPGKILYSAPVRRPTLHVRNRQTPQTTAIKKHTTGFNHLNQMMQI